MEENKEVIEVEEVKEELTEEFDGAVDEEIVKPDIHEAHKNNNSELKKKKQRKRAISRRLSITGFISFLHFPFLFYLGVVISCIETVKPQVRDMLTNTRQIGILLIVAGCLCLLASLVLIITGDIMDKKSSKM